MGSDRIVMQNIFVILNLTFLCMSNVLGSNNQMGLENLRHLCYPGEYNRKDMLYINIETSKMNAYLDVLSSKSVQKLHISIIPSIDNWMVDLDNIGKIHHLTELWIVRHISSQALQMKLKYGDTMEKTNIERLHLKFLYDQVEADSLQRFLLDMPYLQVLELNGLRYSGDSFSIISALHNKPYLKVLKLNQFFTIISNYTFFSPITFFKPLHNSSIMCLEFCDNYIVDVKPGIFDVLPRIRILNVSQNLVTSFNSNYFLLEILLNPTIEVINAASQGYYGNRRYRRSKRYELLQNNIGESIGVEDCKHLVFFALVNHSRHAICELVKCVILDKTFPCSVIPKDFDIAKYLDFNCNGYLKLPIGQNIKAITFDEWNIPRSQFSVSSQQPPLCFANNKLEFFSFANNAMYLRQIVGFSDLKVTGLGSVTHLNLSQNNLSITFPSCQILNSFPNLHHLNLQGNGIQFQNSRLDSICTFFQNLTRLDISSSGISEIPQEFFSTCGDTEMWVNLANNLITETELSFSMKHLLKIRHINLENNKIKIFNKESRSFLQNYTGPKVNMHLGGNPFICNCSEDSLETIRLFQSSANKMITFIGIKTYQCQQYYTGTAYQTIMQVDMEKVQELCHPKHVSPYLIAATVVCSPTMVLFAILLTYKYRFYILTCYYKSKVKIRCHKKKNDTYLYDIFIAYCSEDRKWVHNFLMKTLENKYNFKLCIHLRYVYKVDKILNAHILDCYNFILKLTYFCTLLLG